SESGLSYMEQRFHDPSPGLFLSPDPVSAMADPWRVFCRYCYARNNTFGFVDPDGRQVMRLQLPFLSEN
ncbi:MAG: RHS repeat-associated core domain-containing protein, partial [Stenotrophomonas maltophilia]